ncbi:MAG: glycosyl hydrolase [Lachnospiraceae bacterium]
MIHPVNKNATKEVRAVLEYLESIRGNGILTGQHTQTMAQEELQKIEKVTGKLPALCGFELLSYSPNINLTSCGKEALTEIRENEGTLKMAYEWAEKGGLITFTWHWYSPIGGTDKSFYTKNTDFRAEQVLVDGTPERAAFYHDLDVMAELLKGFQKKQIPILWRPFHEAEGEWFWWGAKGMEVAGELYRLMFRYFTEEKHLDHLIWVWNNPRPEGYVGDAYCDIVTADYYPPEHTHTAMKEQWSSLSKVSPGKPVAIGEIGTIPGISEMKKEKADWLWFMMWSRDFVLTERFTTEEEFRKQYGHPYAITLDRLPFEATLPKQTVTRADALNAFYEARKQMEDEPEMSLDEINAEITAVRAEREE